MTDFWTTADEIPALPGAYVLAVNLSELVVVREGSHLRAYSQRGAWRSTSPSCVLFRRDG